MGIDDLIPPKDVYFGGGGDFVKTGREFLRYFIDLGNLKPEERVLDVGCGIGRMAVALTHYLDTKGSYEGFDVVEKGISWCRERITAKYPNFRFNLADIYNRHYNHRGACKASEYEFPYESSSFDFIILTSVFTHMLPLGMKNYFRETVRVLRKGGRCLITYFLLNNESLQLISEKKSAVNLKHDMGGYHSSDKEVPEKAVGYAESYIVSLYEQNGLTIKDPIHYGSWCGRKDHLSYQDIIIAAG